jgi:hypothetical protein
MRPERKLPDLEIDVRMALKLISEKNCVAIGTGVQPAQEMS